jgi:DNA-binding beta-propeller fold protein YncE
MHITLRITGLSTVAAAIAATLAVSQPSLLAAQQKKAPAGRSASPVVPRQLTWPLPPETPRVRYIDTYHGADDFKPPKKTGWKTLLLGDDEASRPSDMLVKPYGVAVSDAGRVYVTDTAARRVFVFDPEIKKVSFLGESGQGKLMKPTGVAVDDDGKVFIADATLNRVFGYGPAGNLVIAIGHDGELQAPSGLATDRDRKLLYLADSSKHQILCYSTVNGSSVRSIGRRGSEPGEFNFPTNLFVDAKGQLYVADTLNFRIQVFGPDGRFLRAFGVQGDAAGTFNRPKGVAVDSEGHIYVADSSFNNFQIFDPDGTLLLSVGSGGREAGEFQLPAGLFIDSLDRIFVADQGNSRVQAFQYLAAGADRNRDASRGAVGHRRGG